MTENKFLGINTLNYIRKLLRSQNRWLFVSWICQVAKCCREVVSQDTPAMHEIHAEMWLRLRSCPGVLLPPLCTLPCVKFIATSRQTLSWEGAKLGVLEANLWGQTAGLRQSCMFTANSRELLWSDHLWTHFIFSLPDSKQSAICPHVLQFCHFFRCSVNAVFFFFH